MIDTSAFFSSVFTRQTTRVKLWQCLFVLLFLFTLCLSSSSQSSLEDSDEIFQSSQFQVDFFHSQRSKRATIGGDRQHACMIFIGIDEPLWLMKEQNMSAVVQLAQEHVEELNKIYMAQVFDTGSDSDRYFRLGRVQIMFGSCDGFEKENCTEHREKYLQAFDSRHDFSEFCLAYIFTYIDFHDNTAGLASIGTVCRKNNNSGFVTFLNNFQDAEFEQSSLTFAHEVGHNFGALHDEMFEDEKCNGTGHIMAGTSTNDADTNPNRRNFSLCSLASMKLGLRNLTQKVNGVEDCFKLVPGNFPTPELEQSLCGNWIVEPGEGCDCGPDPETCNDDCCYPAHISSWDRSANQTAVSCQKNEKSSCLSPRPIIFALYLPLSLIAFVCVVLFFVLRRDWNGDKKLFRHVTEGQIRIVRANA